MRIIGRIFTLLSVIFLLNSCEQNTTKPTFKLVPPAQKTAPKKPPASQKSDNQNQTKLPKDNQPVPPASNSQIPQIIHKKVRVAALVPLSGKNKELGTAMLNSIILSLFENDKNNNVELVILDSENAKLATDKIIAQNIKTIIGPIFSSNVEAISDMAQKNKISVLSFSNNQDLAGKKGIFLMGFLPEQQIDRIASYAISNGKGNFAIIAPQNQYGEKFSNILQNLAQKKDGNFISEQLYLNSNKDLERVVSKAVNSYIAANNKKHYGKKIEEDNKIYANAILIPESGAILSKIVSLIKKYNTNEREIQIIGSSNWDDISTLNDPNLIGGWFSSSDPEKYRDFEKRYYQIYNKFPPRISGIGYDAALAVIETIRESGKRDLSAEDFINYKSGKNAFSGIEGLFRFLPNGIVQRNFAMLEIKNGKFEVIDSPSTMFFKY